MLHHIHLQCEDEGSHQERDKVAGYLRLFDRELIQHLAALSVNTLRAVSYSKEDQHISELCRLQGRIVLEAVTSL